MVLFFFTEVNFFREVRFVERCNFWRGAFYEVPFCPTPPQRRLEPLDLRSLIGFIQTSLASLDFSVCQFKTLFFRGGVKFRNY